MAAEHAQEQGTLTRRGFLGWALGLGSAVVAALAGVPLIGTLIGQPPAAKQSGFVEVGPIKDLAEGEPVGMTFVVETQDAYDFSLLPHSVWVVKNGSAVTVFSPVCTHLGCQVAWNGTRQEFVCPCHNSVFKNDGTVVSGPAPRSLDTLPSEVKDGVLSVEWVNYVPGTSVKKSV